MRFSWQMTMMLHRFEDEDSFAARMRRATLAHLAESETAQRDLAENYVGLPY
jgi:p-hydroxybenzoate 3-monooxygenase